MLNRKSIILGAAAAALTLMLSGCAGQLADKPEAANGVYKSDGGTLVVEYDSMTERDGERCPAYRTHYNKTGSEYNGKKIYSKKDTIRVDKENNVFIVNPFSGEKLVIGKYDPKKIDITSKQISIPAAAYSKTDEKIPAKEELNYNEWKAASEKARAFSEKHGEVESLSPHFIEMAKQRNGGKL